MIKSTVVQILSQSFREHEKFVFINGTIRIGVSTKLGRTTFVDNVILT